MDVNGNKGKSMKIATIVMPLVTISYFSIEVSSFHLPFLKSFQGSSCLAQSLEPPMLHAGPFRRIGRSTGGHEPDAPVAESAENRTSWWGTSNPKP